MTTEPAIIRLKTWDEVDQWLDRLWQRRDTHTPDDLVVEAAEMVCVDQGEAQCR